MKLILFTVSIFVLGCSAKSSTSVDQFQQIQQEVEQLKRTYDEKISSLDQQLKQKVDDMQMECKDKLRNWSLPSQFQNQVIRGFLLTKVQSFSKKQKVHKLS